MTDELRDEAQRWILQAEQDLTDAQFLLEGQRHNTSCFLAHQAGEKALKGYLYSKGIEDTWGHSIADLCEDAKLFDMRFSILKSDVIFLDKYYYLTRYPSYLPGGIPSEIFDELESSRAIELAKLTIGFVKEHIGQEETK